MFRKFHSDLRFAYDVADLHVWVPVELVGTHVWVPADWLDCPLVSGCCCRKGHSNNIHNNDIHNHNSLVKNTALQVQYFLQYAGLLCQNHCSSVFIMSHNIFFLMKGSRIRPAMMYKVYYTDSL